MPLSWFPLLRQQGPGSATCCQRVPRSRAWRRSRPVFSGLFEEEGESGVESEKSENETKNHRLIKCSSKRRRHPPPPPRGSVRGDGSIAGRREQANDLIYPRLTLYIVAGTAIVAPERSRVVVAVDESSPPSIRRRLPAATMLPARLAPLRQLTTSRSLLASAGQELTLCRVTSKSCLAAEPREKSFIFSLLSSIARAGSEKE